jgi:hypothetical protein
VQARIPAAKAAVTHAQAFASEVMPREARPMKTIATAVDGNGPSAMALLEEHTAEYPRDGLGLGPGRWLAEGTRNIA